MTTIALDLCYQIASRRRVHLSELEDLAGASVMDALDALVERGLLVRELALVCPHCKEDHSFYAMDAEWPQFERTYHEACGGDFLFVPKQLKVVYTPTTLLIAPPLARGPRARLSVLAANSAVEEG